MVAAWLNLTGFQNPSGFHAAPHHTATIGSIGEGTRPLSSKAKEPNEGFYQHLKAAIQLNKERRNYYAQRSNGQSRNLSNQLILFEKFLLPVAKKIERQALIFNTQNIPIVQADFISMHRVKEAATPPSYQNIAPPQVWKDLKQELKDYKKKTKKFLSQNDLKGIGNSSFHLLQQLEELEETHQCHFAMTKHVIESLAYQVLHGLQYAQQSKQRTLKLSKKMIRLHLSGINNLLISFDKKAQKLHQQGIGIIVNDVPSIPFLEAWD